MLALPAVLHSSENGTIKARDARRITEAHIKNVRKMVGFTWMFHKTNTEVAKEANITPIGQNTVQKKLVASYKQNVT
jgi:hypothetical protein